MLSVIVPAFNAENCLPRLFESLARQPDWEVVVVDDGSTDQTVDVARAFLAHRANGVLLRTAHLGPGSARNVGLQHVKGDFVTFVDADDRLVPEVVQYAAEELRRSKGDVALTQFRQFNGAPLSHPVVNDPHELREVGSHAALTSRAAVWGKIYRTAFLREHNLVFPPLHGAEDVVFTWRLTSQRPKVLESPAIGYEYFIGQQNRSGRVTLNENYESLALQSLTLMIREAWESDSYARVLGAYAFLTGMRYLLRRRTLKERPWAAARMVSKLISTVVRPNGG